MTQQHYDFDLFTIGAGSGGVAASRRAGSYGARVAICEESRVGGTCVIRGCVPKKLLVYGAQFADAFADAAGFGWTVGETSFEWAKLIAAKDRELDRLEGIYRKLLADSRVALFEERGRIVAPHTVEVGGERYTAKHILISTGGHPIVPDIPGIKHAITSNEALDLPTLPERIVIVGGGYIACEFAGIFNSLGAEVDLVIRRDKILAGFDDDIRTALMIEMEARGIRIHRNTVVNRIDGFGDDLEVVFGDGARRGVDRVMFATGRRPNTRGLGLDAVGIACDGAGAVPVDEWSRTAVPGIYAIGDVTNRINLTPVAIAEGRALVETLFNDNPISMNRDGVPSAVFSQPPIGTVGLSESEARRLHGGAVDVYRARFRPMKNTLSGRDEKTMMKLVVDRATDRVLGCHMVGPDAPEITQGLAIALKCGATKKQFDQTVGIHPSAAEEFVTMREKVPEPEEAKAAE